MNWTSNCRSSDLTLYTPIALIYVDLPGGGGGGGGLKFRPTIRSWYISLFNHISPFFMFLNLKINLERHAGRAISGGGGEVFKIFQPSANHELINQPYRGTGADPAFSNRGEGAAGKFFIKIFLDEQLGDLGSGGGVSSVYRH